MEHDVNINNNEDTDQQHKTQVEEENLVPFLCRVKAMDI